MSLTGSGKPIAISPSPQLSIGGVRKTCLQRLNQQRPTLRRDRRRLVSNHRARGRVVKEEPLTGIGRATKEHLVIVHCLKC